MHRLLRPVIILIKGCEICQRLMYELIHLYTLDIYMNTFDLLNVVQTQRYVRD